MVRIDTENFTPLQSSLGGVLIGIAAVLLLVSTGRIAGISGALGGIFTLPLKKDHLWRISFIFSLLVGGLVMHFALHQSNTPEMQSWYSITGAALLVGIGTRMGNGCTSGHGVCGLSRLSFRSLVATCTFMAMGVAAAWLLPFIPAWSHLLISLVISIAVFLSMGILKVRRLRQQEPQFSTLPNTSSDDIRVQVEPWYRRVPVADMSAAALSGLIFGLGLSLSGMTQPSKVTSFLRSASLA